MPTPLPKYPVYIISKGRWENPMTARFMQRDGVPFFMVIEPQEEEQYRAALGPDAKILVLPFSNLGLGSIPARNFCWEHSIQNGYERHWIFDDNIRGIRRCHRGERLCYPAGPALLACETFTDRYENIAISGMNYSMFAIDNNSPFRINCHVYSSLLIQNNLSYRWRGRYNEDTDLCLQVLSGGWCTVQFSAFLIEKIRTMTMKGGNSDELYRDDGRLTMARSLERMWPGVVQTRRRFGRPQHVIDWKKFRQPLRPKPGAVPYGADTDEYGVRLAVVGSQPDATITKKFADIIDHDRPGKPARSK